MLRVDQSRRQNIDRLKGLAYPEFLAEEKEQLRAPPTVQNTSDPSLLDLFFEPVVLGTPDPNGAVEAADRAAGWTQRLQHPTRTPRWVARYQRVLSGKVGLPATANILKNARFITHLQRHGPGGKYLDKSGSVAVDQPIQSGKATATAATIACQHAVGYRMFPVLAGPTSELRNQLQCELQCVYGSSWQQFEGRKMGKGKPKVLWLTMDNSREAEGSSEDWDMHKTVAMMPDSSDSSGADATTDLRRDFAWLQEQLANLDGSDDTMVIAVLKKDRSNITPLTDLVQKHPNLAKLCTAIHNDEADLGTAQDLERAYSSPDSVPSLVSDLRKSFLDAAYILWTATTQALRLMNPTQHEQAEFNLMPNHYYTPELESGNKSYVNLPEIFTDPGHSAIMQVLQTDWVTYEEVETKTGKIKLAVPEEAEVFIAPGRLIREGLEKERAEKRGFQEGLQEDDSLEFHVPKNELRDAQTGYLEQLRTNKLPASYSSMPDSLIETLINFVLTGAIRNLRQNVAGDWDYSSHPEFIKTLSGKPDSQPLQALSVNTQEGLGCVGAPSQWQEMELHEYMAQMLGENPEYLKQLRRAAIRLYEECSGTVPYESDMLKDALVCLRNLGLEEELELDAAQFVEAMAGVNLEDMSGMYVMQTVSEALQKLQPTVRVVLQCLGIQSTSQLDSPDPNAIHCRVVVRKEFVLGSPDAEGDNVKHMHVLLRDTPGDRFAKPVLLVPKTQQLRSNLQATSFVQPPVEPLYHAAMFNMTSFKNEQQKLADVIQQIWVILCTFLISDVEVTVESVEAMAKQLQPALSPDNLKFAKERSEDCSQKLKTLFAKCWTRLDIRVQAANSSATPIQLEQILPLAHSICMSAQICILNSGVDGDARWTPSLNYSAGTVATNIIAIGGYKLSRGLAIRGLIVSLLANGAKESVQDALSQLLRLLGHRGRDRDLMCVHMPERLHADYIRLADIYTKDRNGLRDFVVKRLNGEDPPAPEVAAHASMKPTNSTKMRFATVRERENQMHFSCPRLDDEAVEANWNAVLELLQHLHETTPINAYEPCGSGFGRGEFLVFLRVDYDSVINFIRNLEGQDPEVAKNMAETLEIRRELCDELNVAFCRGTYDPKWQTEAAGYSACVREDLPSLICHAARKEEQPSVFRRQDYANFEQKTPDAVCDADAQIIGEGKSSQFVPGVQSRTWFREPSPGADAGSIDNRGFLHRTEIAPGLTTIHLADGEYRDRQRSFKPEDPLAASKPVPLVRLFAAQTGRQVLVRSERPFPALGIAQVYAYRRVLQKLMEQGRLFIRNPFIHQITEENELEWGLHDGQTYLEVIGGERYSVSLSSMDKRLRLTLDSLQAAPGDRSEEDIKAAQDWEFDYGDEDELQEESGLRPYSCWNEVSRSFYTLRQNVRRFYSASAPQYKFNQHLDKLWRAEIAQKSGKPKPQLTQPKNWDRDLPQLLLHWAASSDQSLFPTGYPSYLRHHLLGIAAGMQRHLLESEDSDGSTSGDDTLQELVVDVLAELRQLARACKPLSLLHDIGSKAVSLLHQLQPVLHEKGLCDQTVPDTPSEETKQELEDQAVIVVPPGRQKPPAKQAAGKTKPISAWKQDQLCTPDDAKRRCDNKREELLEAIRKFSSREGGTLVSASNSKEATQIADTIDIHVRKAETPARPNGRRYRFAMHGKDMPLSHAGQVTENVAHLVELHLADQINEADEQGLDNANRQALREAEVEEDEGEDVNKSSSESEGDQSPDSDDARFVNDMEVEPEPFGPSSSNAFLKKKRQRLQVGHKPGPSTAVRSPSGLGPALTVTPVVGRTSNIQPTSAAPSSTRQRKAQKTVRKRPVQSYRESSDEEAQTSQPTRHCTVRRSVIVISDSE